jgi:hypothetical protein
VKDVERLAREIVDGKLAVRANCASRTLASDIQPIVDIAQRTGLDIETCTFIGSSPIRQYAEDWTIDRLQRLTDEAVTFAGETGHDRDVRHGRHHACGPGFVARALLDGDSGGSEAHLHRRYRRPCQRRQAPPPS